MPKFAANLSMLFNEVEFLDRFGAAARAGFKGVEYLFPYPYPKEQLAETLDRLAPKLIYSAVLPYVGKTAAAAELDRPLPNVYR